MRSSPRGAIMIIGLALLSAIAMSAYMLARSAVLTTDKNRSMALADASAKSVATWYAQILNYDAYSNRAIAANEIMIAQAATLASWTHYAQTLSQNIGTVASAIPAVAPLASWIQQTAALSHQMARSGAQVEIPLRAAYARALQSSQQLMHASATPFAAQAMVNEVIWTADPRFFGQIIPSSDISAFSKFSKAYVGDERQAFADMLRQTQDRFSRDRSDQSRLYVVPTVGCVPTNTEQMFARLVKRGSTWVASGLDELASADTLSIHTWRRRSRWDPRCSGIGESIVLGWGAADASMHGGGRMNNSPAPLRANSRAMANAHASAVRLPGYPGLSSHRELAEVFTKARKSASIRVPVVVRLPLSKVPPISAGKKTTVDNATDGIGNGLWSLSVAETYFMRPRDTLSNPAAREFSNLFSPFWAARLVAPNPADRSVALLLAESKDL